MIEIPWVFDMTLVKVGDLDTQASASPKLSFGLQETMDRALQRNGTLQVIMWVENSTGSIKKSSANMEGIGKEILYNITTTIDRFGGKLLRNHHEGSKTLLAALPPQSITRIAENPFIKKLYLNGPLILKGSDNTARLYGVGKTRHSIGLYLGGPFVLFLPVAFFVIVKSDKKSRKKLLTFLCVATVLSLTFMSQMIPSAQALNISTSAIRATDVWATGNRGGGINVAIIDSGIDLNHNDFANAIVNQINIPDGSANVQDTNGHGTHVAGIVAGRGVQNPIYSGVAWDAGLVIVRIASGADLEPAVRWVINNRAANNIRVIQSSVGPADIWGNPILGGDGLEHPYSIAMDDAVEDGIVVVQAAGNSGPDERTIACPGNAFNVITVGASNDQNTANIDDDTMGGWTLGGQWRDFSSRGPTGGERGGRPKPDVVAPGYRIISTRAAGTDIRHPDWDTYIDNDYVEATGTSMAAPHVSGTVALMLNANPNLTPAQVKAILRQTARLNTNLNRLTVNDRGHGIIDAYAAVQLAQNVANINRDYMYDSWDVETPSHWWDPIGEGGDYLKFRVSAPSSTHSILVSNVHYYYWDLGGIISGDYSLLYQISARHVWIDGTYYDLGTYMNQYLFSGPRIYEKGGGYAMMRAKYRVSNIFVEYQWKIHYDEMWLKLNYEGGSSWKTLIYIDPDVWDTTNYATWSSNRETISHERIVYGDASIDIRDPDHTEYVQIDPSMVDNPRTWLLKHGYFGNNPNSVLNDEDIINEDLVVFYQATSSVPDPGPSIYRKTNPPATMNTTQNDAGTGDDAGNNFNQATLINPGSYTGALCYSDLEDTKDWYKFYAENSTAILVSMTPPSEIDFDLELYDPAGNLKAGSYLGPGIEDSVSYTTDSSGYWRAKIYIINGEAQYSFYVASHSGGGSGCPILYVYDGKEYVSEGLLDIHNPNGTDVVTNHTLITMPKQMNTEYLLRLTEHPQTISHIDQVLLFAILQDKTLIELPLISAVHSEYDDVLSQLLSSDDWKTDTLGANWNNGTSQSIDLKFQALPPNIKAISFIFQIEGNNPLIK